MLGDDGLQEITYKKIEDKKVLNFDVKNGWLGITDKYWAATLLPDTDAHLKAHFSTGKLGTVETYQPTICSTSGPLRQARAVGRRPAVCRRQGSARHQRYEKQLTTTRYDLLIDWGWFYVITKPLFMLYPLPLPVVGNFGIAILSLHRADQSRILPCPPTI